MLIVYGIVHLYIDNNKIAMAPKKYVERSEEEEKKQDERTKTVPKNTTRKTTIRSGNEIKHHNLL